MDILSLFCFVSGLFGHFSVLGHVRDCVGVYTEGVVNYDGVCMFL